MTKLISPISIDLGAKYTGVHLGNYSQGESFLDGEYKGVVIVDNNKKTWSQSSRRTARHTQRSLNRRRLAKRFLRVVLSKAVGLDISLKINQQQTLEDFLMGMLNRRGYTYIDEGIDYDALEIHEFKYDFFEKIGEAIHSGETLYNFLERVVREKHSSVIREKLKEEKEIKGKLQRVTIKIFKDFDEAIEALEKAINGGHKHREEYLETIKRDIEKFVSKDATQGKITANELWKVVGNISNFQLRFLRKYFNDQRMIQNDLWDEEKFNKLFNRYISSWHVGTSIEISRLKELGAVSHKEGIELLKKVEPKLTIPPFEDQNNRHPPICETLLLKLEVLNKVLPSWKNFASKVAADYKIDFGFPEIEIKDDLDLARKFQIYLDQMMKEKAPNRINAILTFLTNKEPNEKLEHFLKQYYSEQHEARYGYWIQKEDSILSTCGLKTKHKNNMAHYLIGDILNSREKFQTEKSIEDFKSFLRSVKVGRRTLLGTLKACSEAQEDYGNSLNFEIKKVLKVQPDADKGLKKLVEEINHTSIEIQKHLLQSDDQNKKYSNIYSFAQLYNHLESDIHGFSKTCLYCAKDNSFRNNRPEGENITRLSRGTEKPIDGIVGRLLDSISWKIALEKEKQLINYTHIKSISEIILPIVIEENTFSFSFDLKDIKKQQDRSAVGRLNKGQIKDEKKEERSVKRFQEKWDRIKNDSKGICPYTGESLSTHGEFDHIIPRSSTKDKFQTVFNSECNLIYCSNKGNIKKGKNVFTLNDLSEKFLKEIWGNDDKIILKNNIVENFKKLEEESKRGRLDFADEEIRKILRFALFVEETRDSAIWILNKMTATRVNGTQKYLASLISKKIDIVSKRNPTFPLIKKKFLFVSANERSDLRELLAHADPSDIRWKKDGQQSLQSHIIDAALVYARACEDQKIANELITENVIFSEENVKEIQRIIPKSLEIVTMESKHEAEKDIGATKILAATMTSENYLPIFAYKNNTKIEWKIGFSKDNSVNMREGAKVPDWKKYLLPFAEYMNQKISSFDDIASTLQDGKCLYFTINKTKIYEENLKLKNENKGFDETLIKLLDIFSYRIKKISCDSLFIKQEKNKNIGIYNTSEIAKYYQQKIKKSDFTEEGNIDLPIKTTIEKIYKSIKNTTVENLEIICWKDFFPITVQAQKEHIAVKKTYSLSVLTTEGNIRVRRLNPKKESVWQLQKNNAILNKGFFVQNNKLKGIPTEIASKYSFERFGPMPEDYISMSNFIAIIVPNNLKELGIQSILYRLSEAKRRRCRVEISEKVLSTILPQVNLMALEASYSIKDHKSFWFTDSLLKNMRDDKFDLIALKDKSILIEFTHDGNADVNKAIIEAHTQK